MTLSEYIAKVRQAAARVVHHAAGVSLAERRIKRWHKAYDAATPGTPAAKRDRAKVIFWKAHELRAEDFLRNWKVILKRRRKAKAKWLRAHPPLTPEGFALWRGVAVAPWMVGEAPGPDGKTVNWLQLSVDHGWSGVVTSGVRTATHSVELCEAMCGATSCPGRCAGATSNHNCSNGCAYPEGAIDVGDYYKFGAIQREIGSPLRNELPVDPVHYSVSGH